MPKFNHDKMFFISFLPTAIIISGILVIFFIILLNQSIQSITIFGLNLFIQSVWNPEKEVYGVFAPIIGTFITSSIAVVISLVFSIPLAILITEYLKGRPRDILSSIVELMGGIPTIVYAVWSLYYLAPFLRSYIMVPLHNYLSFIPFFSCRPITGLTIFTASVAIGISLVPYTTSLIIESYKLIPVMYREACLGIGATRYETIKILLSLAKPAIIASAILGFARASGETTIAVTTIGNSMYLSLCLFTPGYTVSALIASQYENAGLYKYAESVLHVAALSILITTLILSFIGLRILDRWRVKIVV
ncbi:MAG: phosphate ABC transporter permease subunit PstC [Ignisphaera sp.]